MMAHHARELIVDSFVREVEESSLSKIRISAFIQKLELNRNTFYYHFSSKYDVALTVFQEDLGGLLADEFPRNKLVMLPYAGTAESREPVLLPFYTHVEIGARNLDSSGFFKAVARCIRNRPAFYRRLFTRAEPEFLDLVKKTYRPAFAGDIDFILGGRYLPETTKDFLACCCADLLISETVYVAGHLADADALLEEKTNPFWNIMQESLHAAIQAHPVNRTYLRSQEGQPHHLR